MAIIEKHRVKDAKRSQRDENLFLILLIFRQNKESKLLDLSFESKSLNSIRSVILQFTDGKFSSL